MTTYWTMHEDKWIEIGDDVDLEKQQPAREAHFKREIQGMRYDEIMKPRQKFHAQIISLVA